MDDAQIPRGVTTLDGTGVHVHFDGACQPPNGPGVATYGFTLEGEGFDFEDCGLATRPFSERATNNVAEYVAAIRALEWLREQGYRGLVIASGDSQLVIRQMRGEYRVLTEHLQAYHARLSQLASEFQAVQWMWIPREQNARADALSKAALEEARPVARRLRRGQVPVTSEDADEEEEEESEANLGV
jgi:ribonuclease HI